jgi:hypothetical protein
MTKRPISQSRGSVEFASLRNVRVGGDSSRQQPAPKNCGFWSCTSSDPDPVDVTQPVKFVYRDGPGNSCHYCEAGLAGINKTMLDHQISMRSEYVKDFREGARARMGYKKTGGVKQVSVKTNKRHSVELVLADDDFWRLGDYAKVFGPVGHAKK